MLKHSSVLLLLSILNYLLHSSDSLIVNSRDESDADSELNKMVVTILQKCNLGLRNIVVYDDNANSSIFEDLSVLQPSVAVSLASKTKERRFEQELTDIETQGIIIVVDSRKKRHEYLNEWRWLLYRLSKRWRLKYNITVFIIPKPHYNCYFVEEIFTASRQLYTPNIYYVCKENGVPAIFTYDPYGSSRSPFWEVIYQGLDFGNKWTLYSRAFKEVDICRGFLFNRIYSIDDTYIIIGVKESYLRQPHRLSPTQIYEGDVIEKKLTSYDRENMRAIKRLTRVKIKYFIAPYVRVYSLYGPVMSVQTSVDILLNWSLMKYDYYWNPSLPTYYDDYMILSHNRGYMTPLEKISNFYGRWTLISFIIILLLTFIVIWLKTRRNIAFAVFDILRLLINGSVLVSIDTRPLKIFFIMIFLYFLVIQATFSGHLAEFLTKLQLRKNADSLEDLKDPRIEKIYSFGYRFDGIEDYKILMNKTQKINHAKNCTSFIEKDPNSACLISTTQVRNIRHNNSLMDKYYCSKDQFATAIFALSFRKQFPLKEKLNRVLLFLTETKIFYHSVLMNERMYSSILQKREAELQVDFRPITLADLKFAFILLGIGNSLGCICFLVEILIRLIPKIKIQRKNKPKTRNFVKKVSKKRSLKIAAIRKRFYRPFHNTIM